MAIKIVTDSACDITQEEARELGITILPLRTLFSDGEYLDGIDMSPAEFYEKLVEDPQFPTTSQVPPLDFVKTFTELLQDKGDEVIYISISKEASGCFQSARVAKKMLDHAHRKRIYLVDSKNISLGEAILVRYAIQLRDAGLTSHKLVKELNRRKGDIKLLALLDTLGYLRRGGRIGTVTAMAGTLLNIKPVITVDKGKVKMIGKARGSKAGNSMLNKIIKDGATIDFDLPLTLAYTGLSTKLLDKYAKDNEVLYKGHSRTELPVTTIGSVVGAHIGPGAIGVAYFEKK